MPHDEPHDDQEAPEASGSADESEIAAVRDFYDSILEYEWTRLDHYVLEYATVQHYLQKYLPGPPARILDVGGGPGRYAVQLAQSGYDVTLVDLVPRNVAWANDQFHAADVDGQARALIGDARRLEGLDDDSFDAALLLGPLYHLPNLDDRQSTVREARRVMRTGGMLFSMMLTRAAAIYEGINRWPEGILNSGAVQQLLDTGSTFNFERNPHDFEGVYFARPEEVIPLHESAGFSRVALAGCESMLGGRRAQIEQMAPEVRNGWIDLVLRTCEDPTILGASERMLYVGRAS